MSKHSNGTQLDLDLSGSAARAEERSQSTSGKLMPFVDSATLQIRSDAMRRVTANGIFKVPAPFRRD